MQKAGLMAAAAAAARRIQAAVLGASTAAAQRTRTALFESSSTAVGSRSLMSRDLLQRLAHKEIGTIFELRQAAYFRLHRRPVSASASCHKNVAVGNTIPCTEQLRKVHSESTTESLTDSGSLKDIEYRILTLETVCNSYKKFQWLLLGPIVVGFLMTVPATINVVYGVSKVKQRQKQTAEELNKLNKRIKYLEGKTT